MAGTAWLRSTHRRCFSCWIGYAWYVLGNLGRPEQIVDIPVPQIEEEITEVDKIPSLCEAVSGTFIYFKEIKVFQI